MRKFFKIIGLLLVLTLMAAGGLYVLMTERADDQRMSDIYAEVETLARQKDDLTRQLDSLEAELALKIRDYSTFEIIFTDIRDEVFTQAYPIMRDHGVVGVLGLSYAQLPGNENKLTVEQINRLLSEGWGICINVDNYIEKFEFFYPNFVKYLEQFKIPAPTAVYFPNLKFYDPAYLEDMIACGIKTVIFNSEDGRSQTVTDMTGDLWITYAMPWNYTGSTADMELLGRTDGGNQVFYLQFSEYWDKNRNYKQEESKEKAAFQRVLTNWDKEKWIYADDLLEGYETLDTKLYMYSGSSNVDEDLLRDIYIDQLTPEQQLLLPRVRSVNFEQALEYHLTAAEKSEEYKQQQQQEADRIRQEIAALDEKIASVYASYENAPSFKIGPFDLSSLNLGSLNPFNSGKDN